VWKKRLKRGSQEINTDTRHAGKEQEREERKDMQVSVATGLNRETKVIRIFNKLLYNTTRSVFTLTSFMKKSWVISLYPRQYKYSVYPV